jgi:hypothetical protein
MPVPVKALWDNASEAEQRHAHETSAVILQYWLGKTTKQEAAVMLGAKPLRVWQLSQQALSGMVAGLLKQPRKRRSAMEPLPPEEDPKVLKKRIAELERELEIAQDVIQLLRDLPANRDKTPPEAKAAGKKRRTKKKAPPKRLDGDRSVAPDGTDQTE